MYVPLLNRMRNNIIGMGLEPERLYKAMKRFKRARRPQRVHLAGADLPDAQAARELVINPRHPYHLLANPMVWVSDRYPRPLLQPDSLLVQRTHLRAGGLRSHRQCPNTSTTR